MLFLFLERQVIKPGIKENKMENTLSVPVAKEILELEREEALRTAKSHIRRVLSGAVSTWINGAKLNFQEQFSWDAAFIKRNLPQGINNETFVCLRCGECCYYSYLDDERKLRPECEKCVFSPRRIIDNKFLPAECKIHDDPVILFDRKSMDPYDLPEEFEIVIRGKKYVKFSEEDGVKVFGKDFWKAIRLRNTRCVSSCPAAQFGPCIYGIKIWENEKILHPGVFLPEGVKEQLRVAQLFRERIYEYLEIFKKDGKKALEKFLAE